MARSVPPQARAHSHCFAHLPERKVDDTSLRFLSIPVAPQGHSTGSQAKSFPLSCLLMFRSACPAIPQLSVSPLTHNRRLTSWSLLFTSSTATKSRSKNLTTQSSAPVRPCVALISSFNSSVRCKKDYHFVSSMCLSCRPISMYCEPPLTAVLVRALIIGAAPQVVSFNERLDPLPKEE